MLEIIFSTKKFKTKITKRPKIQTNEGTAPKSVQIVSHVVEKPDSTYPLVVKPYKLDISQFGEKVRDRIKFTITNVSQEDLDLKLVAFPYDIAKIDMPDEIKADSDIEGEIILLEETLDKQFNRSFTVEVSDDQSTRFTVPLQRSKRHKSAITSSAPKGK